MHLSNLHPHHQEKSLSIKSQQSLHLAGGEREASAYYLGKSGPAQSNRAQGWLDWRLFPKPPVAQSLVNLTPNTLGRFAVFARPSLIGSPFSSVVHCYHFTLAPFSYHAIEDYYSVDRPTSLNFNRADLQSDHTVNPVAGRQGLLMKREVAGPFAPLCCLDSYPCWPQKRSTPLLPTSYDLFSVLSV